MCPAACTTSATAPETAAVTVAAVTPLTKVPRLMVGMSVVSSVTALSPLIAGNPLRSGPRTRRGSVSTLRWSMQPVGPKPHHSFLDAGHLLIYRPVRTALHGHPCAPAPPPLPAYINVPYVRTLVNYVYRTSHAPIGRPWPAGASSWPECWMLRTNHGSPLAVHRAFSA